MCIPRRLVGCCAVLVFTGCGGGGGSPTTPPPASNPYVFTISTGGVSPKEMTVPLGTRVLFINNDNRRRNMGSDPHPEHDDCPALNVGVLNPGQSRESLNLVEARTCGFHDHDDPANQSIWGKVTVR